MPVDRFAARDREYLRDVQYATTTNLNARISLHRRYSTSTVDWFDWLFEQLDLPPSGDVLEVGCGTGEIWTRAGRKSPSACRLTLTDLSDAMVASAVGFAGEHFSDVRGHTADVQQLPFDDEIFDVAVANQVLYHALDPQQAISELARVLRPGGRFVAATVGPTHLAELFAVEKTVFGVETVRTQPDVFGSISGFAVLAPAFAQVEWRPFVDVLRCTNCEDVVRYLLSAPPGENATAKQVAALVAEVDRLIERGDGAFTVTKETGTFVATK